MDTIFFRRTPPDVCRCGQKTRFPDFSWLSQPCEFADVCSDDPDGRYARRNLELIAELRSMSLETEKHADLRDSMNSIMLTPSSARCIQTAYVEGVYTEISLDDYEQICRGWLQFLEDPNEEVIVLLQDPIDRHPYLGKDVHKRWSCPTD